ncbi:2197_t:CDS:2 [Acaulospora morrowiae]|uniref:2197_t:CDS:1 n=1 Tax=Acaulospora morrowiae TaxID=94023 RepID=A0A9N9BKG4_9GLOM|nr:2197_t:CDS:2 [Acaulospora morrowiae]
MSVSSPNQTWRDSLNDNPILQNVRKFLSYFPLKLNKPLYKSRDLLCSRLYIWGPDWKNQEISFDQECLKWQTYLKFIGEDFEVKYSNEPLMSPSGKLPVLILPTGEVLVDEKIVDYAKENKSNKLGELTNQEHQADSEAFIALADTKLRHVLLYTLWCEPEYESITWGKYGKSYAKPLNRLLMYQAKNAAIKEMLTRRPILNREEIYQEAADALKAFSVALADKNYFFDERFYT